MVVRGGDVLVGGGDNEGGDIGIMMYMQKKKKTILH